MHRITKRLLFVLLTIIAYLPMTVVNAMPNVSIPVQTQSAPVMNMMDTAMADATDCYQQEQADKTCAHCASQHASHCASSVCSVSLAITAHYSLLNINRNLTNSDKTLRIDTPFQRPPPLIRPPISS